MFAAIWVALSLKNDKNSKMDRKDSSGTFKALTDDQKSPSVMYVDTRHRVGSDQESTVVTVTTPT